MYVVSSLEIIEIIENRHHTDMFDIVSAHAQEVHIVSFLRLPKTPPGLQFVECTLLNCIL